MKTMTILTLLALFSGMTAQDLSLYRDRKRPVILFAGDASERQKAVLEKASAGLKERDVVILSVAADEKNWHQKYEVKPGEFIFLLLGKDGGVKFRSAKLVSPEKLFAQIDAMPMRKEEMTRKAAQ